MRARACPQRTCVGCRECSDKRGLLRVVLIGGSCIPDLRGTLPGRGAYVHPASACLEQAVRRRAFNRAFRGPGPFDLADLREQVEQAERAAQAAPVEQARTGSPCGRGTSRVGSRSRLR